MRGNESDYKVSYNLQVTTSFAAWFVVVPIIYDISATVKFKITVDVAIIVESRWLEVKLDSLDLSTPPPYNLTHRGANRHC